MVRRSIYVYRLTMSEMIRWRRNRNNGKTWRIHLEGVARHKARMRRKTVAMVLSPDGDVLAEIKC